MRSIRHRQLRGHRGRRALLLLAAVALPAFAAPESWQDTAGGGVPEAGSTATRPAHTGSSTAFDFLARVVPTPLSSAIHADADAGRPAIAGPAALAMRIDGAGLDHGRALKCLTAAIYYEAASESDAGQRAVAQVVLNRVAHPAYPNTVCGVVYQGSERRTGCQFTFTCDGALARVPNRLFWLRAQSVAASALGGQVYAPVGLATHYHTVQVHPYWADSLANVGTIGAHRFYRFAGPAGQSRTFRFVYAGGEPIAAPHSLDASQPASPQIDPLGVRRIYEGYLIAASAATGRQGPGQGARPWPAPVYASEQERLGGDAIYRGDHLPGSQVRPEYEASGRWIAQPQT